MAKSGQIQLFDGLAPGDEPLADSIVFTESTPTSLGGVVADLLDKSVDPLRIVVDFINRRVFAFPIGTDVEALLGGAGKKTIGTITRDDATRKTSPVTMAAGDDVSADAELAAAKTALNAMFAASKPSKSVTSIVNSIEDSIAAVPSPGWVDGNAYAIIDQTGDGSVKFIAKSDPISSTADATAKIKQVPAATGSGPAPLAFE